MSGNGRMVGNSGLRHDLNWKATVHDWRFREASWCGPKALYMAELRGNPFQKSRFHCFAQLTSGELKSTLFHQVPNGGDIKVFTRILCVGMVIVLAAGRESYG